MIFVVSVVATVFVSNNHSPVTKNFRDEAQARLLFAYQDDITYNRPDPVRFVRKEFSIFNELPF